MKTTDQAIMNAAVLEVARLVLEINQKTGYAAFFGFSGHVGTMDVRVCESKENANTRLYQDHFYTDSTITPNLVVTQEELCKIIECLKGFLPE
jgi:hypothetical protein